MDLRWSRVMLAGLGACLVLFIVGPLLRLLLESSPRHLADAVRDPELRASIALTIFTATVATLLAALLGIPLAYLLARLFRSIPVLRRGVSEGAGPGLLATSLNELVGVLRGAVVPYLKGGIELIIEVVSVFVMALYLARNPSIYVEGLIALVPPERRSLARVILYDLKLTLHAWVVGQLIAMSLLAVLTTLGLWLLGIPYFLAFGVFAGIAAIVPFFGTLFSTLIPALFALGVAGLGKAIAVTLLGIGVHLIEANFVAPVVMERQVNLPPVITIAGVLLIGKLFGLAGLIVAVPILAFVMVLIRHILMGEVYGDPLSEVKPSGTVPAEVEPSITTQPVIS